MHSSDETGDEPGRVASTGGASPEPEQGKHPAPAHAFRERIRRASVAAAQATAEPLPVPISSLPPEPAATTSSLPPEHSGVRDRPLGEDASKPPLIATTPVFVGGSNPRRMTPRAWPFAAGTRGDGKRPSAPSSSDAVAAAGPSGERSPGESNKLSPSPGAYSVSPPSTLSTTTTEGASWSPTSTKPQRASLLRTHEAAGESGRYSVRDTSIDYVDAKRAPLPPPPAGASSPVSPPSVLAAASLPPAADSHGELVTPLVNKAGNGSLPRELRDTVREGSRLAPGSSQQASSAPKAGADRSRVPTADHRVGTAHSGQAASTPKNFVAEEDETTSRARRYTPKQRPAQRRGRGYDRGSPGARIKDERAELARTLPDIRTTMPGRPGVLDAATPISQDSPTQPKGRPVSRPPGQLSQPARAQSAPPPLPRVPNTPASGLSSASARENQPFHEASIVVDPELLGAPSPLLLDAAARSTRPGSRGRAQAKQGQGAAEAAPTSDLVDTLPDAISEPSQVRRSAVPLSRYEPLPSDPAAFERLMRERAATRGQPGSRLNWNQQETLLIPRESLRAPVSSPLSLGHRGVQWGVAGAVVAIAVIGTVLLLRGASSSNKAMRAVPLSTTTLALTQAESTVIATEPPGAELLQSGAVLGNTPLEVRRPRSGEIGYVVRLHGFEPETVVISSSSKATIRVALRPMR